MNSKSFNKKIWPVYLLGGFQSLAFSSIFILTVPLSQLFWPGEPYRALEMGGLVTTLFWVSSISGILIGWFIDRFSRKIILFLISIIRGICMIALGLSIIEMGMQTWWYFFIFIFIFGLFAGGSYPAIVALAHDIVPLNQRSRFFGFFGIMMSIFTMGGFLVSGFLMQEGFWRINFIGIGSAIMIAGIFLLFWIKEPKRGSQNEELSNILKRDSVYYEYKISKETMKSTMLSKTNLVALIEGVFTNMFMGSLNILILPYIQSEPYNFSPFATGIFIVMFGLSGGIIGQVFLAKVSDNLSSKNHIRRLYFIIIALIGGAITFLFVFSIPLPKLSIEEGKNIGRLLSFPSIWLLGLIFLSSSSISSLYGVNQGPIIQEINLPEAQGQITSWNQFLEHIGFGAGPLIAGILITTFQQDYQFIALFITLFAFPGVILWIIGIRYYPKDKEIVKNILEQRAKNLEKN